MKILSACLLIFFSFFWGCQQNAYLESIEPVCVKGIRNTSRAIIIYYTRTGNTKTVAEAIRDEFDCDLQEIRDLKDRSGIAGFIGGMIDVKINTITDIQPKSTDLNNYDLIIFCSPTWGMKLTPAIRTFMETADLKNKKVFVVVTATGKMKEKTFKETADYIRSKGGTDAGHVLIKTLSKTSDQITAETKKLIKDSRLIKAKLTSA